MAAKSTKMKPEVLPPTKRATIFTPYVCIFNFMNETI